VSATLRTLTPAEINALEAKLYPHRRAAYAKEFAALRAGRSPSAEHQQAERKESYLKTARVLEKKLAKKLATLEARPAVVGDGHGTRSYYVNRQCRCARCTEANREYQRPNYQAKKGVRRRAAG
jgi:hypothetical protein